jgi:hypothetical protein
MRARAAGPAALRLEWSALRRPLAPCTWIATHSAQWAAHTNLWQLRNLWMPPEARPRVVILCEQAARDRYIADSELDRLGRATACEVIIVSGGPLRTSAGGCVYTTAALRLLYCTQ